MSTLPPPVPRALRDMLKDYPEHIERLQEVLTRLVAEPSHGVDPFDQAIWALENRLGVFVSEAQDELEAATQIGDSMAIELAEKKASVMRRASFKSRWLGEEDGLWDYFQNYKRAFE